MKRNINFEKYIRTSVCQNHENSQNECRNVKLRETLKNIIKFLILTKIITENERALDYRVNFFHFETSRFLFFLIYYKNVKIKIIFETFTLKKYIDT